MLSWRLWILSIFAAILMGCVGPEMMGDRAMERGDPAEALHQYDRAIERGNRDPDLYFRAAKAAQQQGAFARAERYFSQSLRYGGGVEIARALAEFYIQTSNYMQAVRVFQYLLRIEDDDDAIPPLYSNLGAALMYGGQYVDAESYMLLAQQERPEDPVPYINLGVLYDRHLRNLPKAVRFYECFTEMATDANQVRTVQTRLRELENQRSIDASRVNLECGSPYRAAPPERHDLRQLFGDSGEGDVGESSDDPIVIDRLNLDVPLEYEPDVEADDELTLIESDEQSDDGDIEVVDEPGATSEQPPSDELSAVRDAYDSGRYDEVVDRLEETAEAGELSRHQRGILGESYYHTGRFDRAGEVLEELISEAPAPEHVRILLDSYRRLDDDERYRAVCDRFSGWPAYEDVLEDCP